MTAVPLVLLPLVMFMLLSQYGHFHGDDFHILDSAINYGWLNMTFDSHKYLNGRVTANFVNYSVPALADFFAVDLVTFMQQFSLLRLILFIVVAHYFLTGFFTFQSKSFSYLFSILFASGFLLSVHATGGFVYETAASCNYLIPLLLFLTTIAYHQRLRGREPTGLQALKLLILLMLASFGHELISIALVFYFAMNLLFEKKQVIFARWAAGLALLGLILVFISPTYLDRFEMYQEYSAGELGLAVARTYNIFAHRVIPPLLSLPFLAVASLIFVMVATGGMSAPKFSAKNKILIVTTFLLMSLLSPLISAYGVGYVGLRLQSFAYFFFYTGVLFAVYEIGWLVQSFLLLRINATASAALILICACLCVFSPRNRELYLVLVKEAPGYYQAMQKRFEYLREKKNQGVTHVSVPAIENWPKFLTHGIDLLTPKDTGEDTPVGNVGNMSYSRFFGFESVYLRDP